LPKGTILLTTRATIGEVAIATQECTTNQGFQSLIVNKEAKNIFISNWIKQNKKEFIVRANGSTFSEISKSEVESIPIFIPSIQEQEKISSFLSLIDDRIATQNKIIEQLETLIRDFRNQIFKQKIRFTDDNGEYFPEWIMYKLSDISERIIQKNSEGTQNVLTISAQFGLISQLEFFNKSVSAKDVSGYYLLKQNDFAYNKSYSNGYPMGAIKRLKRYEKGIVSTLYICFRLNQNASVDFIEQYFESGIQNAEIEKIAQEGARNHGLLNVGVSDFFNIEV